MDKSEIKRQERKREQVLSVLREKGSRGVTNAELSALVSLRYGAHLGSLYQLGYKIRKESLGNGLYLYTLIEEPSSEHTGNKKAIHALLEEVEKEESISAKTLENILDKLGIAVRYKPNTYNQLT